MEGAVLTCPRCGLVNPAASMRCDCGEPLTGSPPQVAAREADRGAARKLKRAWVVAFAWGLLTLVVAAAGPLYSGGTRTDFEQALGQFWSGVLIIGIALGMRRGRRWAGWLLVAYAVLDAIVRLAAGAGGLILPIVLFVFALPAARHLHRQPTRPAAGEAWPSLLYELAFLQAAFTAFAVAWSFAADAVTMREVLGLRFGRMHLLDVAILAALAVCVWRRWVWAGYALVLYQLANVYMWLTRATTPEAVETAVAGLGFAVVYAVGTYHLHRAHGPLTTAGRVGIGIAVAALLVNVALLTVNRPTRFDRITAEFEGRMKAEAGLMERIARSGRGSAALGRELALKGARRLGDAQLVERAGLMGKLLALLDVHNCAEQLRGGRGTVEPPLHKLDEPTLRAWMNLALIAMIAEHRDSPSIVPNPSEEDIGKALTAIMARLPSKEGERLMRIVDDGGDSFTRVSDEDACWVLRTMVDSVPHVDPTSQRTIARLLVAS